MNEQTISAKCDNAPFFSFIIPVFNTPLNYLDECIGSLMNQTYRSIEIIIVDDGSCSEVAIQCDEYANYNDRVHVLHQNNQGVSVARNEGIDVANGEWIIFIDADDWLDLNACEVLHKRLKEVDCDVLMYGAVKEFEKRQQKLNYGFKDGKLYDLSDVDNREYLYRRAMSAPNMRGGYQVVYYSCDKAYKRNFLLQNNLRYTVGLPKSEDKVFILQTFEKMQNFYFCDLGLYHYRINEGSVCNRLSMNADKERITLTKYLSEIATRMDLELGILKHDINYRHVTEDYMRFVFGIISDVLFLKYFHEDFNAGIWTRRKEACRFIHMEPFWTSINVCKYKNLTQDARLKKMLLSHDLVMIFFLTKKIKKQLTGKVASS